VVAKRAQAWQGEDRDGDARGDVDPRLCMVRRVESRAMAGQTFAYEQAHHVENGDRTLRRFTCPQRQNHVAGWTQILKLLCNARECDASMMSAKHGPAK
jgi:hypothetical protein